MFRRLLVAVGLGVAFGATAAPGSEQAARPTTLATVRGSVVSLAQDGRHVAWVRSRGRPVQILALPGRHPVAVGSAPTRENCWRCFLLRPIAVGAGGRVLWQEVRDGGNTYIVVGAITAARGIPGQRVVASTYMGIEEGNPDWTDPVPGGLPAAADGKALLLYADCEGGELCSRRRLTPGIYRLTGRRPRLLAKVRDPVALAVNGRRFAVVTKTRRCCNFTPAWSHDATRIAWIYNGELWTVRADGTADRRLVARVSPPLLGPDDARRPSWSPDGARLVFERVAPNKRRPWRLESLGIYRVDADGRGLRRLTAGTAPTWSPDGTRIAFLRGNTVFASSPDGTGATRLTQTGRATAGPLSWAPDSTRIAVSRGGDIYSVRADGGGETRLTTDRASETQPTWSPAGDRIAYLAGSTIAVVNADGSGARRLTSGNGAPAWSPDSKRIVFVREDGLWIVNADGDGLRQLTRLGPYSRSPQWAPANAIVVGDDVGEASGYPSDPGIRLVSPASGGTRKIAPVARSTVQIRDARTGRPIKLFAIKGYARAAALGPDYVAMLVDHEPGVRVELYNLNGSARKAVAVPSSVRSISASGRNVVFAAGRLIRRLDARTGAVATLATARRTPVGPTIEGRRVVWAENGRGVARIRAVTAP